MSGSDAPFRNPDVFVTTDKAISKPSTFLRMSGRESLGQLFHFEVDLATEQGDVAVADMLNTPLVIELKYGETSLRVFQGKVVSFSYIGAIDLTDGVHRHMYRALVRPSGWVLTRRANCRIFQKKTVVDIIKAVLTDAGLAAGGTQDFDLGNLGSYTSRDYCVQYRETDLNFVHRLMEEEGIYYFFKHDKSQHTMVFCEASENHSTATNYDKVRFHPPDAQPRPDYISDWQAWGELQSGKYTIRDYNFLKSTVQLESQKSGEKFTDLEVFDYPGLFIEADPGDKRAAVRLGEMAAAAAYFIGGGPVFGLATGNKFSLVDHARSDLNESYLIASATYDLESDEFRQSAGKPAGPAMQFSCVAIKSSVQYRPPRLTPKPFVQGPQTAIVVGPKGDDDIYTDENGRIKVQFYWDRKGTKDENSSCWIRLSSIWAGNAWGATQLPRIGQEVIVDFLEGDPDQPIITGRVYNDQNAVPYTLVDKKTVSTIKSRSSPGGTDQNFNELRFEDKKDSEEVYFHAEKDFNRVVENNDTLKVGFDKKDKGDQTIDIFNNQTVTIGNDKSNDGSQTVTVYKNRTVTIQKGDEKLEVSEGNRTVDVAKGNDTHNVDKGNREVTVGEGNDSHTVSKGNRTVTVSTGNDTHTVSKGNREVKIDAGNDTLTVTQGNLSIKVTAGSCTIEAGQSIELKVGGSSIKIEPAQITLKSPQINATGDGKVAISAPMVQVSGDANVQVKGGIIKIN